MFSHYTNMLANTNMKRFVSGSTQHVRIRTDTYKPSNFDKKVLVWSKAFSNVEEIPPRITEAKMIRARDYMRIRVSMGMILATVVSCGIIMFFARRERQSGVSLQKIGRKKEQELREIGRRERERAEATGAKQN